MPEFVNSDSYVETFSRYRKGMLEQEKSWIKDKIVGEVISTLAEKFDFDSKNQPLRILSVGAGFGDVDLFLLKQINKQLMQGKSFNISYTVVEMNKEFMDSFKKKAEEEKEELSNIEFTWVLSNFEHFRAHEHNGRSFHFIHFFHVLYYMDAELTLQQSMSELLLPGGCIMGVVLTNESLTTVLFQKYHKIIRDSWVNTCIYSKQDLVDIGERNGWKLESFVGARKCEISTVFKPKTPEGRFLLNFFFHTDRILEQISETELKEIHEFFRKKVISENTSLSSQLFAINNDGVVIFHKE